MQQNHKNNKIPKHLSVPIDLALHQPYHSIHIQETSILYPDNHKENAKRVDISDHLTIDKHVFDEFFQQSEYSTQTHPKPRKTQKNTKNTKKKHKSTTKNTITK